MYALLCRVKKLLDIDADDNSRDELVSIIIRKAELFIRNSCNIFDVDEDLELAPLGGVLLSAVEDLAVIMFNRLGSEGLKNETIGPLKMDYDGLPINISNAILQHKRVKF